MVYWEFLYADSFLRGASRGLHCHRCIGGEKASQCL